MVFAISNLPHFIFFMPLQPIYQLSVNSYSKVGNTIDIKYTRFLSIVFSTNTSSIGFSRTFDFFKRAILVSSLF